MKRILSLIPFLFFVCNLTKAWDAVYKNYTIKDGLPSQTIYCAVQDNQGYMWFGTDAGVCRFDGRTFKLYTTNDGLPDNEVLRINKDSKGRIWFLSLKGMLSYYSNDTIYNGMNDPRLANIRTDDPLLEFMEDHNHNLWFGSIGSQVIYLTETESRIYNVLISDNVTTNQRGWVCLYEPAAGKIWIPRVSKDLDLKNVLITDGRALTDSLWGSGYYTIENTGTYEAVAVTEDGIYDLVGEKFLLRLSADSIPYKLKENIRLATVNENKDVWICTSDRQTLYFKRNGNKYDAPRSFLPDAFVGRTFTDMEGNKWICTIGRGIYKVSPQDQQIRVFARDEAELNTQVLAVATDNDNNIWCGLSNGTLIQLHDGKETKFNLMNGSSNNNAINRVLHILPDADGSIFCAADVNLFYIKKISKDHYDKPIEVIKKYTVPVSVKYLCFNRNGKLFSSSHREISEFTWKSNKLVVDPANPLLPSKRCYSIYFDLENRMWFENFEQLYSFDRTKLTPFPNSAEVFGVKINHINGTKDSTLIVSTSGNGIVFIKKNKVIGRLTESEGLVSNLCRRVYVHDSTVYVATIRGFSVFNYSNGKVTNIENYTTRDGIISDDIYEITTDSAYIYLATSDGLCQVNKNLKKATTTAPPVYFTSVYTGSTKVFPDKGNFSLEYNQQDLLINYIAVTYERPEQVLYQYRLNGNPRWEETQNTNIQFSSLLPGRYKFELRARKFNSAWSDTTTLTFRVNPPFWKWTSFRIGLSFLIAIIAFFVIKALVQWRYRKHLREIKQREALITERNRIAADVHDDIGADLSNLLLLARISGESSTMEQLDKARVKRIEHAAKSMISKVDEIIWALNPVNDKLVNVIYFIERYAKEFLETRSIKYVVTVPEHVSELFIHEVNRRNIFLIVKEILNNISKHSGATEVKLDLQIEEDRLLKISIADNGKGFISDPSNTNGRGINNMRLRVEQLKGTMTVNSNHGVAISLVIPLK